MSVGIIGLGAMGGAYARNLLAGGIAVHGFDPDPSAQKMLTEAGGTPQSDYGDWLRNCEMIILSIASTQKQALLLLIQSKQQKMPWIPVAQSYLIVQ